MVNREQRTKNKNDDDTKKSHERNEEKSVLENRCLNFEIERQRQLVQRILSHDGNSLLEYDRSYCCISVFTLPSFCLRW